MKRYSYCGPVFSFERCVQRTFRGETMAVSPEKARNNLTYRWKKENGYPPGAKIELTGKIVAIG